MSVFKCKMCGGALEIAANETVATCEYCGTQQTLPACSDDILANLHNRANTLRLKCEFDKAEEIYNKILEKDNNDAEAHWGVILCKYGIEYVEDPKTYKRVPTCHRTSFDAILADEDYKAAIANADISQRSIYEAEAKEIDRIQKDILAIVNNEKPFDVFVCYKETDENGKRTQDSVIANDIYHQLTQEGFKVFYAAITLEDKIGREYEPYIFAALNSSKVMLVVGSKPEYFNAVWVKNEWSRFLKLMKTDRNKLLIPCYRGMDAYELPEEFSHLQAQDMGKIGFINDVVRGIKKVIVKETLKTAEQTVANGALNANTAPLLERALIFLEDGKWQDANIYCEKTLDIDPKNAEAYLIKLMAELQVRNRKQLADCAVPFNENENYDKVMRFGDEALEKEIRGYIEHINERNETARKENIYQNALSHKSNNTPDDYDEAIKLFTSIESYKDSEKQIDECKSLKNEYYYLEGNNHMSIEDKSALKKAIESFSNIKGYKDVDTLIEECESKIKQIDEEKKDKAEKAAKKRKKIITSISSISAVIIIFVILLNTVIIPKIHYNRLVDKYGQEYVDRLYTLSVGDIFEFGEYEQDNDISNGKEAIEWIVLAKEENKFLVTSKYALACRQYNTSYAAVTWETCTLRNWLNNDFITSAFSNEERVMISITTVSADKNPEYNTNPGNATQDKVFLLSTVDANMYFNTNEARKCAPTAYAIAQGAYTNDEETSGGKATCWWWLRSPGYKPNLTADIYADGSVDYYGSGVERDNNCVRPAMWIELS